MVSKNACFFNQFSPSKQETDYYNLVNYEIVVSSCGGVGDVQGKT